MQDSVLTILKCTFKLYYELVNLGNTQNLTITTIIIIILTSVLYVNNSNIHSIIIQYFNQEIEPQGSDRKKALRFKVFQEVEY